MQLEPILQQREVALRQLQAEARERQDRTARGDKKVQGGIPETRLQVEKLQRKADWDGRRRERRQLKGRIYSGQQELDKKRRRLTEQERPRLEPDGTVRPREGNRTSSGARIRRCTPLPQGAWS